MLDTMIAKFHEGKAKRANGEGGFTLIELLVVVVIIGILIAIAIPLYLNYQKGAKDKSAQSDLRAAVATVNQCYTDNSNTYPAVPAGTPTAGSDLVFACGGSATETAKASDGTVLSYAQITDASNNVTGFTLKAYNAGGNKDTLAKAFSYDSTVGGKVG